MGGLYNELFGYNLVSVTDELRRLLDEHGVEWDYGITGATTTKFSVNGIDLTFTPMRDGLVCSTILTPEQAIEVTLGRGTCHVEGYDDGEDELLDGTWVYREPTWHLSCGHEVHGTHQPNFCPNCGKALDWSGEPEIDATIVAREVRKEESE